MGWALAKAGLYSTAWKSAGKTPGSLKAAQYVCVSVLESIAKALLEEIRVHQDTNQGFAGASSGSYTQTVYTRDLFYKLFHDIKCFGRRVQLSNLDMDVLLKYLSRDLPRISIKDDTIKVNLLATSFANIEPVSEQDRAVAALRQTVHDVVSRIEGLSARIQDCDNKAKEALASKSSNSKTVARYALRSRKLAQTTQESSFDMLANLEQTLVSIDNASSTVDIMASLRQGVTILSSLNQAVGGAEKVAELMDELHDNIGDADEIGREISSLAGNISDAELEDELEQMLVEEKQKEHASTPITESRTESETSIEDTLNSAPKPPQTPPKSKEEDLVDQLSSLQI